MPRSHPELDHLRDRLKRLLPEVKSSHVAEALARSVGHRTNAALLASLGDRDEPVWHVDGRTFVEALNGFGYRGVSVYDVSRTLPKTLPSSAEGYERLASEASAQDFARFVASHQSLISKAVAVVFPGRAEATRDDDMNSVIPEGGEPRQQVAHDCLMLTTGRGDTDAMRRRIVGWCILADTAATALAHAYRCDPDFRPVADIAAGGWKAALRGGPFSRRRMLDDETDHERATERLTLPWPGRMGADMPFDGAHVFAAAARCPDVLWFPDRIEGPRLFMWQAGQRIILPDDPGHEAAMRPLLESGRDEHVTEAPGLPGSRLSVGIASTAKGRRVLGRLMMSSLR